METKNYYISDKDFVTGYLVGRTEAYSDKKLSDDCIEEIADMVYEDEKLGIDEARAIIDYHQNIYFKDKDKPNAVLSYDEIVNSALFKTGYVIGCTEANAKNKSTEDEILYQYGKMKNVNPDFTRVRDACDENVNPYFKEYVKSCKLDGDGDESCDCEDCEDYDESCDYKYVNDCFEFDYDVLEDVKKVIFSGKATIIIWEDGTKTIVKCQKGDKYDPEKGLVMALLKGLLGNDNTFNNVINELMKKAIFSKNEKKAELPKKKSYYYTTDNEVKKGE